jgi:hypothetical protein
MAKNATNGKISRKAPQLGTSLAVLWRTFWRDLVDPYRPELHYMRGPGPKWHAKHGLKHGIAQPTLASPAPTHATPAAA